MEPVTVAILLKNLDGLSMRASVNAQNIANAGTPGYRPLRVSFESALVTAAAQGEAAIRAVAPSIVPEPRWSAGEAMRLDLEVVEASLTAGRYSAMIELLNRHAQIAALAVSGGR